MNTPNEDQGDGMENVDKTTGEVLDPLAAGAASIAACFAYLQERIPDDDVKKLEGKYDYVTDYYIKGVLDHALGLLDPIYAIGGWRKTVVKAPWQTERGEYEKDIYKDGVRTRETYTVYYVRTAAVVRLEIPAIRWYTEDQGTGDSTTNDIHLLDEGEAGKVAITDAFKRCARELADRAGRYLYRDRDDDPKTKRETTASKSRPASTGSGGATKGGGGDAVTMPFGMYMGDTLESIMKNDQSYLEHMIDEKKITADWLRVEIEKVLSPDAPPVAGPQQASLDTPTPAPSSNPEDPPEPGGATNSDDDLPF